MKDSVQHELDKWLTEILKPVSDSVSTYYISVSCKFSNFIRNSGICSVDKLLVSFDILSLYTNVPLQDTLHICTDALYQAHLGPTLIPEALFLEFMHLATEELSLVLIILYMPKSMGSEPGISQHFCWFL